MSGEGVERGEWGGWEGVEEMADMGDGKCGKMKETSMYIWKEIGVL